MDFGLLIGAAITIFIFLAIGGGIGYWFWKKSRPKLQSWNTTIWQIGEGVRKADLDKKGKPISDIELHDLKPYATDILQKIEKGVGVVQYRLLHLRKLTPPVEADIVDNFGPNKKEVNILFHKGECTFLKKGYDKKVGEIIFRPLPQDTINLIKGEISERQDRLKKEKDILEAISPWIVTGVVMLGLIGVSFIMVNGYIKISEINEKTLERSISHQNDIMGQSRELMEWRFGVSPPSTNDLGVQDPVESNVSTITITE